MKEKGDLCILVGYSTQSKGYRVYNKRTRMIVESIHIRFDEIKEVFEMSVANDTSGLVPLCKNASDYDNSDLGSNPQDKQPTMNIQPTSTPSAPTYVHAEENEEVYVAQPDGFVDTDHPEKVYRLKKARYGLKQAPKAWYDELSKFLTSKGFTKGFQIHQSPRGIFINQAKYTLKILHKHGMEKGQSIDTPMAMKPKLDADLSGNRVDQTDYRSKTGSLMYLTSSRPDIVHEGSIFGLTAFSDADHAGCIDTRKSTSGGIQFLVKMEILLEPTSNKLLIDLDTISVDDLYNNVKIVAQEVKRTVVTSSSSGSPNMAFLSSPGNTNEVDNASIQVSAVSTTVSTVSTLVSNLNDATVYAFLANQPNRSQLVHEDLEQFHEDDLEEMDLKWQLALLCMRARRYFQKTGKKITIIRSDTTGYDTTKVECFNCHKMGHFEREYRIPRNQESFDWSYMADDEVPTNMALMDFLDSEINSRTGLGFTSYNAVAPPPTGLFVPLTIDLSNSGLEEFQHPEFKGYGPKDSKSVYVDTLNDIKKAPNAPIIKDWVSDSDEDEYEEMVLKFDNVQHKPKEANQPRKKEFCSNYSFNQVCIVPISTARQSSSRAATPVSAARPINTAAYKPLMNVAKPRQNALQTSHSLSRRPFYQQTAVKNKNLNNNVNTAKANSVNTAKGNKVTSAVGNQETNAVKSLVWVLHKMLSRHMTENISYLTDFKENDERYVAFGGGAKGGKVTGKSTIRNGKLDFKDVYLVKELQFNLFSVLQMCDKKNSVLFIDTECFVLSPNLKLADESQVLLKVPRKNNMYSFDMKNIVPQKDLTCLLANDTNDESMLWHRRLGYINFKDINKLVKDNLAEAVNIVCYEQNRVLVVKPHFKTPYELFNGRSPTLSFMRPFGCHVSVLNTLYQLGKFDGKSAEGIFVGYFTTSKAFRVYNIRTRKVEENLHITFLENKPMITGGGPEWLFNIDALSKSMNYAPVFAGTNSNDFPEDAEIFDDAYDDRDEGAEADYNNLETVISVSPIPSTRIHKDHPKEHIIREVNSAIQTKKIAKQNEAGLISFINKQRRTNHKDFQDCLFAYFLSQIEPKKVYRNKRDQRGIVVKNRARLVAYGHRQEKGIDYDEVFSPVAPIEAIRLFLAYASFMDFTDYQMDVKSIFLYGTIEEEVYVSQPLGFVDLEFPDRVYKTKIHVDNESAICVVKNHVYHSKTKHIEIRHHFIIDSYDKRLIEMVKKHTDYNVADLLLKPLMKKVVITESSIRHELKLNDTEGTSCLPNAMIFEDLARMGYEKPSVKPTFYKAFFSPQWKFFIHTILQYLSAKTTSWNEFSSTMASAIICITNNQKFNFLKYILDNLKKNFEASVPFYMFPRVVTPLFDIMMVQPIEEVGDLPTVDQDTPIPDSKSSSQPQRKHNPMRKEKKEKKKPRFLLQRNQYLQLLTIYFLVVDSPAYKEIVMDKEKSSKQGIKIADIDADTEVNLENVYNLDLAHEETVLSTHDATDANGKEVAKEMVEVITSAKIIVNEVSTADGELNVADEEPVSVALINITTAQPTSSKAHVKGKGKAKLVEEPEVLKSRKEGPEMDVERTKALRKRTRKVNAEKDQTVKKQKGDELKKESAKKQKLEEQQEAEELKRNLKIIPDDEDDVFVNVAPLSSKPPTIMDYKIYKEGKKENFQIIRANGNH
nr:hypothetical protein [Tanacetum cinerariifolium]